MTLKLAKESDNYQKNTMLETITGYFDNDIWDINTEEMQELMKYNERINRKQHNLNFSGIPEPIKLEAKYWIWWRFTNDTITAHSAFGVVLVLRKIGEFIENYYPEIDSIRRIPYEKYRLQWTNFLSTQGYNVKNGNAWCGTYHMFYKFINDFYDDRDEFEKDIWDCRKIDGASITKTSTSYLLNFTDVPLNFMSLAKKYLKYRTTIYSYSQCRADLIAIRWFFIGIHIQEPEWTDLQKLTRKHMECFFSWYRTQTIGKKKKYYEYLTTIRSFLEYIQRAGYSEAPKISVACLIFQEDIPRMPRKSEEEIKYIPEEVIRQFDEHIEEIKPERYVPVVIVMRASGWRISDVLSLRYDKCLEHTSKGWYLKGDISKVALREHRIPITEDVAKCIASYAEEVAEKSTSFNNPHKLLFNTFHGQRRGISYTASEVLQAINKCAEINDIRDMNGKRFHFKNHAFRHTKAVELINNGMNVLHVQKWLAHASPEMTMRYAKILDDNMRASWEEVIKKGLFRIDTEGNAVGINPDSEPDEDLIEWEYIKNNLDAVRLPLGYCMKPSKVDCRMQQNPCLNCHSLCTTPDFIPEFRKEIREIEKVIKIGRSQGRTVWVEKNESLLEQYTKVLKTLEQGKIHGISKASREYIKEENDHGK